MVCFSLVCWENKILRACRACFTGVLNVYEEHGNAECSLWAQTFCNFAENRFALNFKGFSNDSIDFEAVLTTFIFACD